jgi:hypothetical protein
MKVFSGGIHVITISALRVIGTEALLICDKFIETSGSLMMVNVLYMIDMLVVPLISADILVIRSCRQSMF